MTSTTSRKGNEKKNWTKEAILCLIEAYKEETCLYAVNTPNYHNKHVRNEALKNVCAAVSVFKPGITESECAAKFHNLRNQFNIENTKVKTSMKSGTSTDDVYKPNLWYFNHLKFLETYFTPRKSRNSIEKKSTEKLLTSTQDNESSETQQLTQMNVLNEYSEMNEECMDEEWLDVLFMKNSTDEAMNKSVSAEEPSEVVIVPATNQLLPVTNSDATSSDATTSMIPDRTSRSINIPRPPPPISPANSTSSSSGINSDIRSSLSSTQKPRKKCKSRTEDTYAGAIESLADSMKQPIIIKSPDASTNNPSNNMSDPVDTCMAFVGSMLKRFKNDMLKFEIMNTLVQTVLNASTKESESTRHN